MTHAQDCGRRCRCTSNCCLRRDPKHPRVARCICQTCWLNADYVPPVKALENPQRPTHTTHRHLKSLADVKGPMPHGEGFCPRCIRLLPLNKAVGADSDTLLPTHTRRRGDVYGNIGQSTEHCPGSGQPPSPLPIGGELDSRIRDMREQPSRPLLPNGNPIAGAWGIGLYAEVAQGYVDEMTGHDPVEGPQLPDHCD